jgi:hypothetical protein
MSEPVEVADHISVWIADGGSIHIQTTEPNGDPVELSEEQAHELVKVLRGFVAQLT